MLLERTGVQTELPTASVVSAAFKRERRVLMQMVVLVLIYVACWMPFWTLYTWFLACFEMYWKSGTQVTGLLIYVKTYYCNDIFYSLTTIRVLIIIIENIPIQIPDHCNDISTMMDAQHYLQYLGYINSFINPFIYTGFNQEFRNVAHIIFDPIKCLFLKCLFRLRLNKHPSEV